MRQTNVMAKFNYRLKHAMVVKLYNHSPLYITSTGFPYNVLIYW